MADNNTNRDNQAAVAEDDPFAELARIMNQGAQGDAPASADAQDAVPGPDVEASAGAELADLERELLDEPDDGYRVEQTALAEPEADAPAVIEDRFAEDFAAANDVFPDDADDRYAAADAGDEDFQPAVADDGHWEAADDARPDDAPFEAREWDAQPVNEEPADNWQPVSAGAPAHGVDDDAVLADVDMDFGDLDATAGDGIDPDEDMPAYAAGAAEQTADARDAVSLEDELEMLLAAGPAPAADLPGYAGKTEIDLQNPARPAFPEPPQSSIFGRANFAGNGVTDHAGDFADDETEQAQGDGMPFAHDAAAGQDGDGEPAHESDPFAALSSLGTDAAAAPVDFETVDVPEPALAQQDDLDLPDLPEDVPLATLPEYDFDGQFAYEGAAASRPTSADMDAAPDGAGDDGRFYSETLGFGAERDGDGDPFEADPFDTDMDRELDAAIAMPGALAAGAAERPNRRSGFIVAGAVLGIALLGGIGAFALSFGGGDSGAPVLVQADDEPMKIKPDDPGGVSTVPNQDSVAYEAAAGGGADQPSQESLVSAEQEPVNIASRTIDTRLPGVDDELAGDGLSGKASDRLAANSLEARQEISDDVIAVQPRRVRTMIVRPDGTLVPREDTPPAEAEAAEPAAEEDPAAGTLAVAEPSAAPETAETLAAEEPAALPGIPLETVEEEPVVEAAAETEAATEAETIVETEAAAPQPVEETAAAEPADPVTPRVGPVAESRPADQSAAPPTQVAQAAPAATRTQPAAPAAAAAATSEWSMQIASQPSAESAQATYQDLARRYGELLGGRGVNIVRADIPGKGTYYRVRIPTSSRSDGVALCERYKAMGGSCFVSK